MTIFGLTRAYPFSGPVRPGPRFAGNADKNYMALYDQKRRHATHGTAHYGLSPGRWDPDPFVLDTLHQYLKPQDAVLELGCNTGNNLLAMAKTYTAYGVDLESLLLDHAKRQANVLLLKEKVNVAQWDFAESGHLPPQWDHLKGKLKAIVAVQTLGHLTSPQFIKAMQTLTQNYLAPGGIVVFTNLRPSREQSPVTNAIYSGGHPHSSKTLARAFKGLKPLLQKPFAPGEGGLEHWTDPITNFLVAPHMSWHVYQKPVK